MEPQSVATFHTVSPYLFWLVAIPTGVCAIATVVTQNIVRAATWLLFTLAGTSALFFLLGADIVGATQLLVYVGGTLVLVVFGVMLTAQGPFISMKTSGAEWAISVIAGMLLLAVLATGIMSERILLGPTLRQEGNRIVTPDVRKYAPEYSRAEREAFVARLAKPKSNAPVSLEPIAPGKGGMPGGPVKGVGLPKDKGGEKGPPGGAFPKGEKKGDGGGKKKQGGGAPGGKGPGGAPKAATPPAIAPTLPTDFAGPIDPATSPQAAVLGEGFLGVGVGPAHSRGTYVLTKAKLTKLREDGVPAAVVAKLEPLVGRALTRDGFVKELSVVLPKEGSPADVQRILDEAGQVVRASYLLPFEIVSVHLLVVLIGAAYLARAKRRQGAVA